MSKENDKASVFRTTKIRTKLKGDNSWLKRNDENDTAAETENQEDKPWLAEVRASRLNGAPEATSPASSPVTPTPPPTKPDTNRAPTTGYRNRGIYTPPSPTSASNGFSKTTQFTKPKPSDSYKKIAPHTVRPTSENQGSQLSVEEQEKRTEAASNVLKKSSVNQRSYVLSAASKFESPSADAPEVNTVWAVAKPVTITDEDETAAPARAAQPASPVVPVTSVASPPEPTPPKIVNAGIKTTVDVAAFEPVAPKLVEVTPEPAKKAPLPKPVGKDLFEDTAAGSTKVATPLPELIAECIQAASTKPESDISRESETVYDISRPSKLPTWPPPKPTPEDSDVPELPAPVLLPTRSPTRSDAPEPPAPVLRPTVSPSRPDFPEPPSPVLLPTRSPTRSDVPKPPTPVLSPTVSPSRPDFPEPPSPVLLPTRSPTRSDVPKPPAPVLSPTVSPSRSDFPEPPSPVLIPVASPTRVSDVPEPPAPVLRPTLSPIQSDIPELPAPVLLPIVSPTRVSNVPELPAPVLRPTLSPIQSDIPELPAPVLRPTLSPIQSDIPELPAPVLLPIVSPTRVSNVPELPAPVLRPTLSPIQSDIPELPAPVLRPIVSPSRASPAPVLPVPMSPAQVSTTTKITVKTEPEPEPEYKTSPKPSSNVDMLTALSDTLLPLHTTSSSIRADEPKLAKDEGGVKDSRTTESSLVEGDDDEEDSEDDENLYKYEDEDSETEDDESEHGNCEAMSDDLQEDRPGLEEEEETDEEVPPGNWSQDLLSELHSEFVPKKSSGALDFLTDDVIAVSSEARSLSMQPEEEKKQTDETAKETQSKGDDGHVWSSRVTTVVTESSSADPFDPYPIGTASPNSSSDLLQPLSSISVNRGSATEYYKPSPEKRMSSNVLESLADDVTPVDTGTTRISSRRSWARTWDTSSPPQAGAESSQEAGGQTENQQTMIKFERKSSENDSPWDRWTSPTVYTVTTNTENDEQERERSYRESQTVTTITTVRETHRDLEPVTDRYESFSRTVAQEEPRPPTPEPESKKGFVYLKEYVNSTEMSSLNSAEGFDRDYDYLTSSSINYNYSTPKAPLSSTCTFCGQQVGDDSKITIEHLGINCHPTCFKCGVCSTPMGDLLHSMFIHAGKVHCESCYSKV